MPKSIIRIVVLTLFLAGSIFLDAPQQSWGQMDLTTAIIKVAKQNIPAVVHIEVTERQEVANPFFGQEQDPFFRRFFGLPKNMPKKFKREVRGIGSGMIIDSQGHIVTNHHVAGGASKIEVMLSDGRKFTAKVVGTDPKTDLAVIKIDSKETLPQVTFGDSDKVEVGEWVVAIGHPRGLDQTVTQGIISAKHRRGITDPGSYQDFLQTDAAINPGNSGGPLLNLKGEVIGVNAAIASESGGFEGIGFTIPSNIALHVTKALIQYGKVERGWLGVTIRDMTPDLAKTANVQNTKGAYVEDVVKGGPADQAGIKKGDIILNFGGKEVTDSGILRDEVANAQMGKEVKVTLLRQGKKEDRTVKIGSQEQSAKAMAAVGKERLGVEVKALDSKEAEKYGLESNQGVMVTKLDSKGPLEKAGFEVGDLILAINNQPIVGLDGFNIVVSTLKPHENVTIVALDHRTGKTGEVKAIIR